MTTLSELAALAAKATPQAWDEILESSAQEIEEQGRSMLGADHHMMLSLAGTMRDIRRYIAGCTPERIAAMCAVIEAADALRRICPAPRIHVHPACDYDAKRAALDALP